MIAGLIGMMAAAAAVAGAEPPAPAASPPSPPAASAPAPATPAVVDSMDKIQCRRLEETGTRLGSRRICMTLHDWASLSREARIMTEDVQNRAGTTKTPGS